MNITFRDKVFLIALGFLGCSVALFFQGLSGHSATTISLREAFLIFEIQVGTGCLISFAILLAFCWFID